MSLSRRVFVAALAFGVACREPVARPVAAPRPVRAPSIIDAAPPADPYRVALDLDFEQVADGWATGWAVLDGGAKGVTASIDRVPHGGATSLRLHDPAGARASAARVIDAAPFRGKRVRVRGWVKSDSEATAATAGFWLGVDSGDQRLVTDAGPVGADGWREASAAIDVPADGLQLLFGPSVRGGGTAWFDDLRLEVTDTPAAQPLVLGGVVVDPSGAPVGGAVVALIDEVGLIDRTVRTGADGRFAIHTHTGSWGLSVNHERGDGAFADSHEFTGDVTDLRFALGAGGGVRVRGRVISTEPVPDGMYVRIGPVSDHTGDVFAVPIDADGRFTARLPRGDQYWGRVGSADWSGDVSGNRVGDEVAIDLRITHLGPPPAEVTTWVKANAAPLVAAEAGHGFADLAPIGAMVGNAHLVGLGEATHGTREFFQLKHRILEYLVATRGFTVFAIEANLPECRAINDYVLRGVGDPRAALDGIYFWIWNTEEVLAMLEWMRAWNAEPSHRHKIQFFGFDMQTTKVAYANVRAFLAKVVPREVDALTTPIAALAAKLEDADWGALPEAQRTAVAAQLGVLAQRFAHSAAVWSRAAGKDAFLDASEDLRVMRQAVEMMQAGTQGSRVRDRAMADNIDAMLRRQPGGTRAVLWAHNGHVERSDDGFHGMGHHLRATHGIDYTVLGFAFGQGSFQAIDMATGKSRGLQEETLGPPPPTDVSAAFAIGVPILAIDLRRAPPLVAQWFAAPRPMREAGSDFYSAATISRPQAIGERFDAVIYVDRTTRARPNPGGLRPAPP